MKRSAEIPVIITAAETGNRKVVLEELRRDPKAVHIKCRIGYTALHAAVGQKHIDIVKLLLKHGADVKAECNRGDTPLHIAAEVGSLEIGKLLVKHGAEIRAANSLGMTPLSMGTDNTETPGAQKLLRFFERLEGKKDILSAVVASDTNALRKMLAQSPDLVRNHPDPGGLLFRAVAWYPLKKNLELIRLLLEHGADPNASPRGAKGEVPLLQADAEVAELLLQHGARPNVTNFLGQTLLDVARQHNLKDLEEVLLRHGGGPGKNPKKLSMFRPKNKSRRKG